MSARFVVLSQGRWATWRFIGGNNRSLAMAGDEWMNVDAAGAGVERMRVLLPTLLAKTTCSLNDREWVWSLVDADEHVWARSSRSFQRRRECAVNIERVRAEAATAPVAFSALPPRGITDLPRQRESDTLLASLWG